MLVILYWSVSVEFLDVDFVVCVWMCDVCVFNVFVNVLELL